MSRCSPESLTSHSPLQALLQARLDGWIQVAIQDGRGVAHLDARAQVPQRRNALSGRDERVDHGTRFVTVRQQQQAPRARDTGNASKSFNVERLKPKAYTLTESIWLVCLAYATNKDSRKGSSIRHLLCHHPHRPLSHCLQQI